MSWFDDMWQAAALGRYAGVILLSVSLAACGFRPLHSRDSETAYATGDDLAAILVYPLPDRSGQQMHNLLRDGLNPRGQPGNPRFGLRVTLSESTRDLGIRRDATATRANLTVVARFALEDYATRAVLFQAQSRSTNSYDILEDEFANSVSRQDALRRALREVSIQMKQRLAVYFKGSAS